MLGQLAIALLAASTPWQISYSHSDPNTSLNLREVRFADAAHGIAIGLLQPKRGDPKPAALRTTDAGANWTQVQLKSVPKSVAYLDPANLWLAAVDGIWKSTDGGATFRKLSGQRVNQVHFFDAQHGIAVGGPDTKGAYMPLDVAIDPNQPPRASPARRSGDRFVQVPDKQLLETRDGGRTRTEHPFAPRLTGARMIAIDFAGQHGAVLGMTLNPANRVTVLARTSDAGANWTLSQLNLPGLFREYRVAPDGTGYALFWPQTGDAAEVYRIPGGRAFGGSGIQPTGIAVDGSGEVWVASATPAKLYRSPDGATFTETPIDGGVTAGKIQLTAGPGGAVWAVTDTGVILQHSGN